MAKGHVRNVPLTKEEREIILTIADDEDDWWVHVDSAKRAPLLAVARSWGREPIPVGSGWQVSLPRKAVKFVKHRPKRARKGEGAGRVPPWVSRASDNETYTASDS